MKLAPHPVTLRQLQYVVAVAEAKSFRAAAERCRVSQPSLSAQIAEVESALSVRLFDRDRRRVLLTAAGAEVVERARRLLTAMDELLEAGGRHADPLRGAVRIGVIPTIAPYLLPRLAPALRQALPGLQLTWTEDKTAVLTQLLEGGEIDAAVVALESNLDGLEHAVIGSDPFVLAAAPGHPLAGGGRPARFNDLRGATLLLLEDGHCLRDQVLDLCAQAGAEDQGFRATSLATLTQMVASGAGITLLPRLALAVENRGDRLCIRPFTRPAPSRTIVLAGGPGRRAYRLCAPSRTWP